MTKIFAIVLFAFAPFANGQTESNCLENPASEPCRLERLEKAILLLNEKFEKLTDHVRLIGGDQNAKLQLKSLNDVTPQKDGAILIGDKNQKNLTMDDNEIMSRENGKPSELHLNNEGGGVVVGHKQPSDLHIEKGSLKISNTKVIDNDRNVYTNKLRIANIEDVTVAYSNSGAMVIGNPMGENIGIDSNEIHARDKQGAATLYLNPEATSKKGEVYVGGNLRVKGSLLGVNLICKSKKSGQSEPKDDAQAIAECDSGYTLTGCSCSSPWDGCGDGAYPDFSSNSCIAQNSYDGNGVYAQAICCKIE